MALLAILTIVGLANAGTIIIQDNIGALSIDDRIALTNTARQWPFDSAILINNVDRDALVMQTSSMVATPKTLAIGVAPSSKRVVVRTGGTTGVPPSMGEAISKYGGSSFSVGNWRAGIEAIGDRAATVARQNRSQETIVSSTPALTAQDRNVSTGAWVAIGLTIAFFVVLAIVLVRRQNRTNAKLKEEADKLSVEAAEMAAHNIRLQDVMEKEKWGEVERKANLHSAQTPTPRRKTREAFSSSFHAPSATVNAPPIHHTSHTTTIIHEPVHTSVGLGIAIGTHHEPHMVEHHHHHHHDHYERSPSVDVGGGDSSWSSEPSPPSSRNGMDVGGGDSNWDSSIFDSSSSSSSDNSSVLDIGGGDSSWGD